MIRQNLAASLTSLRSNPLRSFLTMSGIVVGIAAVIAVLSIGKGHQERIEDQIQRMGANVFWVSVIRSPSFGGPLALAQVKRPVPVASASLTVSDADAIRDRCTAVRWSAPVMISHARGMLNQKPAQFSVVATSPDYQKVKSLVVVTGRYLTDEDLRQMNNVCVVEEIAGMKLSSEQENSVTLDSRRFEVIGMIKREDLQLAPMNSVTIHIPLTVSQAKLLGSEVVHSVHCMSKDQLLATAKYQVETVLNSRTRGRLRFEVRSARDLFRGAETLAQTATMVTAGIGALSLFVGGIGIMNILLASVLERTKEVGIRKAVGARRRDILHQFLFESLSFSFLGGILGIALGFVVNEVLSATIEIPAVFSLEAVLIGFLFSSAVGLIFGVYPAWKAANLDPIEALRYE